MTSSAPSSPTSADQVTRDSFIPLFTGRPEDYKEWRKRIHIYHRKMTLSKRMGESLLNIIGSLTGTAWRLVEDYDLNDVEKPDSFDRLIKLLDVHFEYDSKVQLPGDFDGYFTMSRRSGQTLLSYVTEHGELHKKLERHGVSLPNKVQGWFLLRQAGLTREQRQLVTLKAPGLEVHKITEALYLLFGQDYKSLAAPPRDHAAMDEASDWPDDATEWDAQSAYYEASWDEAYYEDEETYDPEESFDYDAGYYEGEEQEDDGSPIHDVEAYDEAYAAYLDARKRFSDLKLARGYLPVVALTDPAAGNLSPGTSSQGGGSSKGSYKGKKGKGKGGGKKGKSKSATYRYDKPPMKAAQPQQRAQAALQCLRCGMTGHTAATCSVKTQGTKRAAAATESMALHQELQEGALVTFMDKHGQERVDVAMLDPGASAFLCGYGPMMRYLHHLQALGFPINDILFYKCDRKFHFGGDAESMSRWVIRMPMFVNGRFGYAQVFLVKGETPMLCGRPIIQQLGIALDFETEQIRFKDGIWQPALNGLHGEYLLPLCSDFDMYHAQLPPDFDLRLATPGEIDVNPHTLPVFQQEEQVYQAMEPTDEPPSGTLKCQRHLYDTMDALLVEETNKLHGYVTQELHHDTSRVIWEVYCGKSRTSQLAETMGATVRVFSYDTGWDFDQPSHRRAFLEEQARECPDEVLIASECKL